MRAYINNKVYDTQTAREVGHWEKDICALDFHYSQESLYCKKSGEYFLLGEGGPNTQYAEWEGVDHRTYGHRIIPMTYDKAQAWAQSHLDADIYDREFGAIADDDSTRTVAITLPATVHARIKREAQKAGTSVSALIASKFTG